ncbi:uncharacterized protein FFMR_11794 [Fusarium fujikuroi]|nr:uncharacterized protein FFE2_14540 [Fusarium fujikuroi]SCO54406.1 uncharacterized protein FFMR_11794 [Fusarium fujikuroi]
MAPTVWSAKLTQNPVAKRFHNPSSRGHRAQQPCSAIPTADVLEQNNVGFATHHRSDGRLPLLTCAAIRVSEISPPLLRWDRRTRRDKNKTGRSIGEDAFPAHDSRKAKIRHHKTGKLADVSPAPDGIPLANPADNMPASKLLLAVGTTKTAFLLFLALLKPAEPTAESLACRIGTIISKVTLRQQQGALYSRASYTTPALQEPRVSSIIAKSPNADSTQEAMLDHLSALDEYFQP